MIDLAQNLYVSIKPLYQYIDCIIKTILTFAFPETMSSSVLIFEQKTER